VLQQKLDLSVEELTDAVVDKLLDEQGGALDLTDEQQDNLAKAKGSKRRSLLEQVGSGEGVYRAFYADFACADCLVPWKKSTE
jgi:hypothetical protein